MMGREEQYEEYERHARPDGDEADEGASPGADGEPVEADVVEADAVEGGVGASGQAPDTSDPEALAAALSEAEGARDEYLDLLQRERAEFENFRRRANRERMEALDKGAEAVVADLLSVVDNFRFVLQAAEQSEDQQLSKGVAMVHDELWRALRDAGLETVPGEGAPFDPNHHEAVEQVEAEGGGDEPTVVAVLRPGYRFKGRVLRPASVQVSA